MTDTELVLKPCPFCGNAAAPMIRDWDDDRGPDGFVVVCDARTFGPGGCGSASCWAETRERAAEAWNRRALSSDRTEREWQPIDTAPKDGTRIDGWLVERKDGAGHRLTNIFWDATAGDEGEWTNDSASFSWPIEAPVHVETGLPVVFLSHWRPLPGAPK